MLAFVSASARLAPRPPPLSCRRFFSTIFKGVVPFILADMLRLVILIVFPAIALWLPGMM